MPTINIKKDALFKALGIEYTDKEFQQLCFAFGLELDDITSERQMLTKEQGADAKGLTSSSEDIIYRIDIPANRYDLLCIEGLASSLLVFLGKVKPPVFHIMQPKTGGRQVLKILPETFRCRPYAVAAVLRGITFTQLAYDSFFDLQEKLHQNICRKRTLVAIGIHDLDKIQGPFTYDARAPKDIIFTPLNQSKKMNGDEVMELYSTHDQLKQYLPIIQNFDKYPVIYDANGVVLSLPPIINSDDSKISLETKNIFIECTATDLTKAIVVLDTMVCMLSVHCKEKFSAEECEVIQTDGSTLVYPELNTRRKTILASEVNSAIGIDESVLTIADMLTRMYLKSEIKRDGNTIELTIPPTRHDIIHACDVYEDIAIAYGYNNIKRSMPSFMHIAKQYPLNKLTEELREQVAQAGFTEALTFTLCSKDDVARKLNKNIETVEAIHISNPKTLEFQIVRPTLLPGLLKTLAANRKMTLPQKLFEISDIVMVDESNEVAARNERRLCAVNCNKTAGFEIIHGLLDRVMQVLQVPWKSNISVNNFGYWLEATSDIAYFPGRCANIRYNHIIIGKIGVLHPNTLQAFNLLTPCSVIEINIEPFV